MCAGFLRIRQGEEPLDMTGIHPESYKIAEKLLKLVKFNKNDIGKDNLKEALNNPKSLKKVYEELQAKIK